MKGSDRLFALHGGGPTFSVQDFLQAQKVFFTLNFGRIYSLYTRREIISFKIAEKITNGLGNKQA